MSPIPTDAILRAVAKFIMPDSVEMQAVFHLKFENTGGSDDHLDVLDDMAEYAEKVFSEMSGQMSENLTTTEVETFILDEIELDWDRVGSSAWTVTFAAAGNMMPHGVAALVLGRTVDPDVTGKKFMGGLVEAAIINSDWASGTLLAMLSFCADWVASFAGTSTGSSFTPGVWSLPKAAFFPFRDSYVANAISSYQRRRKPGVGI